LQDVIIVGVRWGLLLKGMSIDRLEISPNVEFDLSLYKKKPGRDSGLF